LVVPPADSAALAGAIERFFKDGLGDTFRANIARTRERFSWEGLLGIIEELKSCVC
jgi:glycosyltransferase involved in cell wall biosynthesis